MTQLELGPTAATGKVKPLISYYMGKQRIASQIVALLPPHTVFGEPFAGGLAVLFAKGIPPISNADNYRETVNDKETLLINLYRTAVTEPEAFLTLVEGTPYSLAEYNKAAEVCRNPLRHTSLELALSYYIICRQSFAQKPFGGWGRGVATRNMAATWDKKRQEATAAVSRLRRVHFDCVDALDFIRLWDAPQTVFYCDPPYPETEQGMRGKVYTQADFERLVSALDTCQASFLLSCYDNPAIPQSWERFEIAAVSSASNGRHKAGRGRRKEVVWRVDRSQHVTDGRVAPYLWTPAAPAKAKTFPEKPLRLFDE